MTGGGEQSSSSASGALTLVCLTLTILFAAGFVLSLSLYMVDHQKVVEAERTTCKARCVARTTMPSNVTAVRIAQISSGFTQGDSVVSLRQVVMPSGDTCWIVARNEGHIYQVCGEGEDAEVSLFADYSELAVQQDPPSSFGEAGLGGIEFHPNFRRNGIYWIVVTTSALPINTTQFAIQSPQTLSCNRTTWPDQNSWDGTIDSDTSGSGVVQELRQYTYVEPDEDEEEVTEHTFEGLLLTWYGLVPMHMGYDAVRYHRNSLLLSIGEMLYSISYGQLAVGQSLERWGGKIWKIDLGEHPGPMEFDEVPVTPSDLPADVAASLTLLALGGRNLGGLAVDTQVVSCGDYFAHTMNGQDTSDMGYVHIGLDRADEPLPNFGWPYWEGRVTAARRDFGQGCNTSLSGSPGYIADRVETHTSGYAIDLLNHYRPFVAYPSRADLRVDITHRSAGAVGGVLFRGFGSQRECPLFVAGAFLTRTEVSGVLGFNDPDVFDEYGYTRGIGDIRVSVPRVLDTQYEVPYTRLPLHLSLLDEDSDWGSNGLTQVTALGVSLDGNTLVCAVSQTGGNSPTREVALYELVFA
jgi:hypothetical protein